MNRAKKASVVFTILIFFITLVNMTVRADNIQTTSNIDAILVLDSSGSMKTSDPNKISTEAVKMFIDMCHVKGDRMGMIAFSDKVVRECKLEDMSTAEDKQNLKDMATDIPLGQWTDTGMALKRAVAMMDSEHKKENKPIIILLSDGKNDPERNKKASEDDLNSAISAAKTKNYPIYTIGLNADGSVDKDALSNISKQTSAKSFITNTAEDLPEILRNIFADNLNLKVINAGTVTGNGDYEDVKITIPDANVVEANISMLSANPIQLKLLDNNGKEITIPSQNAILSTSKKYTMLKLLNPSAGDWTLKVKGINGDKIDVNLVFNYDLQVLQELSKKTSLHKGDSTSISAYLSNNGNKLQDKALYKDMTAKLIVTNNSNSQDQKELPLSNNGNNFSGNYKFDSIGSYKVKVRVDGKGFYRESEETDIVVNAVAAASVQTKSKNSLYVAFTIVLIIAIIIIGIVIFLVLKKQKRRLFGQIKLEVIDNETGEALAPQYRRLDNYQGQCSVYELLAMKDMYIEASNIKIYSQGNRVMMLKSSSACIIQKSGRTINATKGIQIKANDRIIIMLTKVSKKIILEYF